MNRERTRRRRISPGWPVGFGHVLALALLAVLFAQMAGGAANLPKPIEYSLGAGDKIQITVFGHDDLSGEFTVSETGTISLPLFGSLILGGLSLRQAEQRILDALKPDYLLSPQVGIEVLNYRPFYIIGEVNDPGAYPYIAGMTVTEAVALGGGFTYRARKEQMIIIRGSDPAKKESPISATDVVLPGDVIKIRERLF